MSGLDADGLDLRPILLEILAKHLPLLVVEVGQKQAKKFAGPVLEHRVVRRVERRDHRFEQMHVRILPPRHRHRQSFVNAAVRRAQLRFEEMAQRVDLGANLRVAIEPIDGCKRQQHERVVVGIAQRIQHRAVRLQRVDKAGLAVGGFRLGQKVLQPLQRDRAAVGIPAHLRRLGVAIDLARLHENPPRRRGDRRGRPRSSRSIKPPALSSQPSVDHSGRQWSIMRSFSLATISAESSVSAAAAVCVSAIGFPGTSPTPVAASDTTSEAARNRP